jgi:AraC-like DNA-binding protein
MTALPGDMTEMPDRERAIRDGLKALQLSGAILLKAELTVPWAYESPAHADMVALLKPQGRRLILFHIFTAGRCTLSVGGHTEELAAGDIAIFPFAHQHRMGAPSLERCVPIGQLLPPMPWLEPPVLRHGGGGEATRMVCGYFYCDDQPCNPVLASLPPFIRVRKVAGALGQWVDATVRFALDAGTCDPRLFELLFTECLCDYAVRQAPADRGWIAGLSDPVIGRALALLQSDPKHPWTLAELAKRSATSRSVLDERFRALLGQAPMGWLTGLRLQLASRQLRSTKATIAEVADSAGYSSEASFSRAFKRHTGVSPGEWRANG